MRVTVTQEDIDKGICGNAVSCAIAKAVSRKTKSPCRVSYDAVTVHGNGDEDIKYYRLSTPAKKFIAQFDMGNREKLKPVTFSLKGI